MKKLLSVFLLAFVLVLSACSDDEPEKETPKAEEAPQQDEVKKGEPVEKVDEPVEPEESEESEESEEASEPVEAVSREFKNALRSAENYITIMAFSEKGLFEQLTSEYGDQYPKDAAQYAMENIEVDYNEQALKAAENYQEIMPMSDKELFEQLTSEYGDQYTKEQAQYAIDNLSD